MVAPSIIGAEASSTRDLQTGTAPSVRIGRYRPLEIIGEGGFGTVWMAEQTEPVRRKVALKIIRLGMDNRQVVARFEAERRGLPLSARCRERLGASTGTPTPEWSHHCDWARGVF